MGMLVCRFMVFVSVSTNTAYIGNARTVVRASTFRVSVLPGCNVALPGCTGVLPGCTGVLPGCKSTFERVHVFIYRMRAKRAL